MKTFKMMAAAAVGLWAMAACRPREVREASYDVIPMPQSISYLSEGEVSESFVLKPGTQVRVVTEGAESEAVEQMERNAQFLIDYVNDATGIELKLGTSGKQAITLQLTDGDRKSEGYTMKVEKEGVTIASSGAAGVFYGIQTLRKSLPLEQGINVALPLCEIKDEPRFSYRGAHLDVCRHFFTLDSVKIYLDMMALHNMNTFHWHISEDQGWRIEIKKYPELTEKGSVRHGTMMGRNWSTNDSIEYGGYYTQDEAREIVRYAAERYITVIPEIDMPGHMQAALCAYPELGCTGGPYDVWTVWGVSDDVLCMGNEKVVPFVCDVLDEVMDIFPASYVHFGGDECPKTRWHECPKCQAKIKSLGLKADKHYTAEQKLQSWFMQQIDAYVSSKGRTVIGWDEILEGGLSENAVVMSWRGTEGGYWAAKEGHRAIMSPASCLYLNFYQTQDRENEPLAFDGYCPISRIYNYEPVPEGLTEEEQALIWGVQGNVWSEYIKTFDVVQYMFMPRAAALAEIQWTDPSLKTYDGFLERLPKLKAVYDLCGYRYSEVLE